MLSIKVYYERSDIVCQKSHPDVQTVDQTIPKSVARPIEKHPGMVDVDLGPNS